MSEARITFVPPTPPSAFGYLVQAISSGAELGGTMLLLVLETNGGTVQIRCTPEWALSLADTLQKRVAAQSAKQ